MTHIQYLCCYNNMKTLSCSIAMGVAYTVQCKLFAVENFRGFHGLPSSREGFPENFCLIIRCLNCCTIAKIFPRITERSANRETFPPRTICIIRYKLLNLCLLCQHYTRKLPHMLALCSMLWQACYA